MSALTLAVDSSNENLSVALLDHDKALVDLHLSLSQPHSQNLMAAIDWILKQVSVASSEIDKLAVCRGPGAFSGLRIGIASMQGLAQALNKPLCTFIGHDLVAAKFAYRIGDIAILTDARRQQVYWSLYRSDGCSLTRMTACRVDAPATLAREITASDVLLAGSGVAVYEAELAGLMPDSIRLETPHAKPDLAFIAGLPLIDDENDRRVGLRLATKSFEPLYVRASDAEINRLKKMNGKLDG